jgi:hypothetical protein
LAAVEHTLSGMEKWEIVKAALFYVAALAAIVVLAALLSVAHVHW